MPGVFISHSSADKPFARRLSEELRRHQIRVWIDERQIKVGDPIPSRIATGIGQCEFFLLIISKAAILSKWVESELNSAYFQSLSRGSKTILPVLTDDASVPDMIHHLRYADFRTNFDDGMSDLLKAFDLSDDAIAFMSRAERISRIRVLLSKVDKHGETPIELAELAEDESYLSIFESELRADNDRRVLLNAIVTVRYLAEYAMLGRSIRRHTSIPLLLTLFRSTVDPEVKLRCVESLIHIDSTICYDELIEILKTEPLATKAAILATWQHFQDWVDRDVWIDRIIEFLHEMSTWPQEKCVYFDYFNEEADIRFWVFRCLGHLQRAESVAYIEAYLATATWPLDAMVEAAAAHWYITRSNTYMDIIQKAHKLRRGGITDTVIDDIKKYARKHKKGDKRVSRARCGESQAIKDA